MAHGDDLPRNPLAETFFELRWRLMGGPPPAPAVDPQYKLLVGGLYAAVREAGYGFHEQLDAARVPDEFVPYLMQHRFRAAENGYPLLQVGPGIFAVNETGGGYSWKTFKPRILDATHKLRETYSAELVPVSMLLRYVNAIPFNPESSDAFTYLRDKLKVGVDYPAQLFTEYPVERRPNTVLLESTHRLREPAGVITAKFSTGPVRDQTSLLWETQVQSAGEDVPPLDSLEPWLDQAHAVARAWFFTFISGDLEAEFRR